MLKHASFFTRSRLDILKRQTMKPASALSGINYTAVQPICFSYYMHFSAGIFFFFFFARLMQLQVKLWMHFHYYGKKISKKDAKHTAKLLKGFWWTTDIGQDLGDLQFLPTWNWLSASEISNTSRVLWRPLLCHLKLCFGTQINLEGSSFY